MPRLLSFAVFLATWWIAALLAGDAKLPPPPAVLAVTIAEAEVRRAVPPSRRDTGARRARLHPGDDARRRHRLSDGPGAARRSARRSLADPAAQSAGARRHRARLYLGRTDRSRRHRGDRHQQAADRRRHPARGNARARRGARRNGDGIRIAALDARSATSCLPQLAPYIAAAARSGLSLVWKIVLVAELLGRPNGVGFEIGVAFQLFDMPAVARLFAEFRGGRARHRNLAGAAV